MPTRIFLSYARSDDEPFVKRLNNDLKNAGFTVWFDRESLHSFHEGAAVDYTVNEEIVEFYGLGRQLGFGGIFGLIHDASLLWGEYITPPGLVSEASRRDPVAVRQS